MIKETDLAWAAGFIDGEGCIFITKRHPTTKGRAGTHPGYHSVTLSVSQIDKEPLLKLQKMFGGGIAPHKPHGNRRPYFHWIIYSKAAREALQSMLPYLTVKKLEAEMVLKLDFSRSRMTEEKLILRNEVEEFLRNHHATYVWAGD